MPNYTELRARAFETVRRFGAAVTFSKDVPATVDQVANRPGEPTARTWTGNAVEEEATPGRYSDLNLQANEIRSLFYVPSVIDELPDLDSGVTWGGRPWTLRAVDPIAPDGRAIAASLVIAR